MSNIGSPLEATTPTPAAELPAAVAAATMAPDAPKASPRHRDAWPAVTAATGTAAKAVVADAGTQTKPAKRAVRRVAVSKSAALPVAVGVPAATAKLGRKAKPAPVDSVKAMAARKTHQTAAVSKPAAVAASAPSAAKPVKSAKATKPVKNAITAQAKAKVKAVNKPAIPATSTSAAAAPAAKPQRVKDKLVRDSFTMPGADFALIHQLKERALGFKRATKKSELLRAGLQALASLGDAQLQAVLGKLTAIKAGRPKKAD